MNDYQGLAVTSGDLCTAGFMLIGVQLSSNQGLVRIVDKLRAGRCCHFSCDLLHFAEFYL